MQVIEDGELTAKDGIVTEGDLPPSAEELKAKYAGEQTSSNKSGTGSESKPQNGKEEKPSEGSNPEKSEGGGKGEDESDGGKSEEKDQSDKSNETDEKDKEDGDGNSNSDSDSEEAKDKKENKDNEQEEEEEEDDKEHKDKKEKKEGKPKPKPRPKLPEEELRDETAKDILARYRAGIRNIWMVGPAGCGKSTIADLVAQVLGVPFYMMSCGLGTSAAEFIGYKYPEREGTRFADYYKIKAVILLDEFTALDPSVAQVANGALANGMLEITTVDDTTGTNSVLRHEDCLIIATSNTFGTGANPHYVANNQLDASTIDRFTGGIVQVDYSAEYEAQYDSECVDYVWMLRKLINDKGLQRIASTRMIQSASMLKAAGIKNWKDMLTVNWSKSEQEAVKLQAVQFERLRREAEAKRKAKEEAKRLKKLEESRGKAYNKSWKVID